MNKITNEHTNTQYDLSELIPYFCVYNLPIAADKKGETADTISVDFRNDGTSCSLSIALTVYDAVSDVVRELILNNISCASSAVTPYVTEHVNMIIDTTKAFSDGTVFKHTAPFNPCCCVFTNTEDSANTIDVMLTNDTKYALSEDALYISANDSVLLNVQDRTLDGVLSINGMLPVNGNINIVGKHPIYIDTFNGDR